MTCRCRPRTHRDHPLPAPTGAASDAEARLAARSIGNNQLIKCSWYGADAYWGRVLAEAGSCGAAFETATSAVSTEISTSASTSASAAADDEELEYLAMRDAARASLRLLIGDPEPARRVVLAADVPAVRERDDLDRAIAAFEKLRA